MTRARYALECLGLVAGVMLLLAAKLAVMMAVMFVFFAIPITAVVLVLKLLGVI